MPVRLPLLSDMAPRYKLLRSSLASGLLLYLSAVCEKQPRFIQSPGEWSQFAGRGKEGSSLECNTLSFLLEACKLPLWSCVCVLDGGGGVREWSMGDGGVVWTVPELPVPSWMPAVLTAGGQSWGRKVLCLESCPGSQLELLSPYCVGLLSLLPSHHSSRP